MSTSRLAACAALAVALSTLFAPAASAQAVTLTSGGHLEVLSAYLRKGGDQAVVRGMVRSAPLWRGPTDGHLDVTASTADGRVIARQAARWSGRFASHGGALPYQAELGVPRADVARLSVSWAPGSHRASETYP